MSIISRRIISAALLAALLFAVFCSAGADDSFAAKKKIHLKKTKLTVGIGKTFQQKLLDKNGRKIKATKVKWKSRNKAVAKISRKGKIKGVKTGTAKMTARYKGRTYRFTVRVKLARYSAANVSVLSTYVANASDYFYFFSSRVFDWSEEGYASNSKNLSAIKTACSKAGTALDKAKAITRKHVRIKCISDTLTEKGLNDWNTAVTVSAKQCRRYANQSVADMSESEKADYGMEMLALSINVRTLSNEILRYSHENYRDEW